jgi:DNA-binding transcriptional LysR family regulator
VQPDFIVWKDLEEGRLETLMPEWSLPPIALHMVTPSGAHRPAKVTALIDFLVRRFTNNAAPWNRVAR